MGTTDTSHCPRAACRILTHTDGATGVQLAARGALTGKGASIVPADTVHTGVRGALIDICGKKGTVTAASAMGPGFLGQKLGRDDKEHEEKRCSAAQRTLSPGHFSPSLQKISFFFPL